MNIHYRNGNYSVTIRYGGHKVRMLDKGETEWKPNRLENVDLCVSNECIIGCKFCYNNSRPNGEVANIDNVYDILGQLPKYTEVAIGGGSVMRYPGITGTLTECKRLGLLANITVHQSEFMDEYYYDVIKRWQKQELVHGVGVSITDVNTKLLGKLTNMDGTVAHCIVGIHDTDILWQLRGVPMMMLGFKDIGRAFKNEIGKGINDKINHIKSWFWGNYENFFMVGFDNLALRQLEVKEHLDKNIFDSLYLGEDGNGVNCYINAIDKSVWLNSMCNGHGYKLDEMSLSDILRELG